jgi:ABC-type lipoprotein release transport system permease subunit
LGATSRKIVALFIALKVLSALTFVWLGICVAMWLITKDE